MITLMQKQQLFKNLLTEQIEITPDIQLSPPQIPTLTLTAAQNSCCSIFEQGVFNCTIDLEIQNAALRCEVLQLQRDSQSKCSLLEEEKKAYNKLEERMLIERNNHQLSLDKDQALIKDYMDIIAQQKADLAASEEKYTRMCELEIIARELCDQLKAEEELLKSELNVKKSEFKSEIDEKNLENEILRKQLSDTLSEKSVIEESFLLFKNSLKEEDLRQDEEEGSLNKDRSLMIKIRFLQESNAQQSAELKGLMRKFADVEVQLAAMKEELSLSDRMKNRLNSCVDSQTKELELLEQKLLFVNKQLLQEQTATDELRDACRNLELQFIQSKFLNERCEKTIQDLKETNQNLTTSLVEQKHETKTWVDRLKNYENVSLIEKENYQREYQSKFESSLKEEAYKLSLKERDCIDLGKSLQLMSTTCNGLKQENSTLKSKISSLEKQIEHFGELEELFKAMQEELEEKETEIQTLCQAFEKRGDTMKELEKRISLQASEISFLRPEKNSTAKSNHDLEYQLAVLQNEKNELLRVAAQNDSRGTIIDELKLTIVQYEQKLKDIIDDKEHLKAVNNELDLLKSNYRNLKDSYEEGEATMVELSKTAADEIEKRDVKIRSLDGFLIKMQEKASKMQDEIDSLKQSKARLEKCIKAEAPSSMFGFLSGPESKINK